MTDFFIADPHFGHANITKYRPQFQTPEEHDETIVSRWNGVVTPNDTVHVLGDFAFPRSALETGRKLTGRKILVAGNHDRFRTAEYLGAAGFSLVCGVWPLPKLGVVLSHAPLHPDCLKREGWGYNVHGHLHADFVRLDKQGKRHPRYICVSCEHVDYAPKPVSAIKAEMASRADEVALSEICFEG